MPVLPHDDKDFTNFRLMVMCGNYHQMEAIYIIKGQWDKLQAFRDSQKECDDPGVKRKIENMNVMRLIRDERVSRIDSELWAEKRRVIKEEKKAKIELRRNANVQYWPAQYRGDVSGLDVVEYEKKFVTNRQGTKILVVPNEVRNCELVRLYKLHGIPVYAGSRAKYYGCERNIHKWYRGTSEWDWPIVELDLIGAKLEVTNY